MDLYNQITELHTKVGPCIPFEDFGADLIKLLTDFKEEFTDWHDNEVFWVLANLDRYNKIVELKKQLWWKARYER